MSENDITTQEDRNGFVYVLAVRNIELPVCKIGMTSRDPEQRCAEINRSSTGDFLWKVHWSIHVNDRFALESLAHQELADLRQRGREFFGMPPADGAEIIRKLAEDGSNINIIEKPKLVRPTKNSRNSALSRRHLEYANLLDTFNIEFAVVGRPFGQLSKPYFGISDDVAGVQWNLAVYTDTDSVRLGVNLEGMKYDDWPIRRLILAEMRQPQLADLVAVIREPDGVCVHFRRDAWQVASRPVIRERDLGATPTPLSMLTADDWQRTLKDAISCLDAERDHKARARVKVTRAPTSARPEMQDLLDVSPHLVISAEINRSVPVADAIRETRERLAPIHAWMEDRAGSLECLHFERPNHS